MNDGRFVIRWSQTTQSDRYNFGPEFIRVSNGFKSRFKEATGGFMNHSSGLPEWNDPEGYRRPILREFYMILYAPPMIVKLFKLKGPEKFLRMLKLPDFPDLDVSHVRIELMEAMKEIEQEEESKGNG